MSVVASSARKSIPHPNNIQIVERFRKSLQLKRIEESEANLRQRHSFFPFNRIAASPPVKEYPSVNGGKMNRNKGGIIVPDADACAFTILAQYRCRMNQTDLGFVAFAALMKRGFCPDTIIVNTLIIDLCIEKRIEEALEVFDKMPHLDCERDAITYSAIISAHCKEGGSVERALGLFQEMIFKGILPDVVTYNSVLFGHFSLGQWKEAARIFEQMVALGVLPNAATFTTLIHGFSKSRRMDRAMNMFNRMQQEGLKPDVVIYSRLIDGLCKVGRVDGAQALLDEMLGQGMKPSVVTFNTLIAELCKDGSAEDALALLDEMIYHEIDPNAVTIDVLINALCKEGMPNEARKLLDAMFESGMYPNPNISTHSLIEAAGTTDSSLNEESNESGIKPNVVTFNTLITELCKDGSVEDALALLDKMIYHGIDPNAATIDILIDGLCKEGMPNEAHKLLDVMFESGMYPDISTYFLIEARIPDSIEARIPDSVEARIPDSSLNEESNVPSRSPGDSMVGC